MSWTINFLGMPKYPLGILDLVSLTIIIVGSLSGMCMGFFKTATKQLSWVLAFPIALIFTSFLSKVIDSASDMGIFFATLLSFLILSVGIFHLINLIGIGITKVFAGTGLTFVNRTLGLLWGILVSSIVVALMYALIAIIPGTFFQPLLTHSAIYRLFSGYFISVRDMLTEALSASK